MIGNYLRNGFRIDKERVTAIHELITELMQVYPRFFDGDKKAWPYLASEDADHRPPEDYSFSTNAMIMFALATSAGLLEESALVPTRVPQRTIDAATSDSASEFAQNLRTVLEAGIEQFVNECDELSADHMVHSYTFGDDDPFTLTWILAVCRAAYVGGFAKVDGLMDRLLSKANERLQDIENYLDKGSRDYGP